MAGSRTYRTRAIVLDKVKLKETDLILTLLAETGRQVQARNRRLLSSASVRLRAVWRYCSSFSRVSRRTVG